MGVFFEIRKTQSDICSTIRIIVFTTSTVAQARLFLLLRIKKRKRG